jgi:hypothetical protein
MVATIAKRVGFCIWLVGASIGVSRVVFDKTLSAESVGLLMLAVFAVPALLALDVDGPRARG